MYPSFDIFGISIYFFGIWCVICFILFVWMLKRLSIRLNYKTDIYFDHIWKFLISILFFGRVFYIIDNWSELKYIDPYDFFLPTDYQFNLIWALFGFFLVLFVLVKMHKEYIGRYLYGFMLSFLFILPIWYFWALLGGQVYGIDTNFGIEITYNQEGTVPFVAPIFPLPIVYSILFFIAFCGFYIANMYTRHKVLLGYISLMTFSIIIFFGEFFTGKYGFFKDSFGVNFSQIGVSFIFVFCLYKLYQIYKGKLVA